MLCVVLLSSIAVLLERTLNIEAHHKPSHVVVVHHADVVLLGDSLTQWGDWANLLPGIQLRNLGIAGQKAVQVEERLNDVLAGSPYTVVLLVGTNDILQLTPQEMTYDACSRIITHLRENRITVIVNAVPYLGSQYPGSASLNVKIASLNVRLHELAITRGLPFINLPELMPDVDNFRRPDGVHFNNLGYATWASALKPFLPPPKLGPASSSDFPDLFGETGVSRCGLLMKAECPAD